MTSIYVGRIFTLTVLVFLAAITFAHAGGGTTITELTGPAEKIFLGLRAPTFIRAVVIALFGLLLIGVYNGHVGGGWITPIAGLLALGSFFGAEAIADTIFTGGAVI